MHNSRPRHRSRKARRYYIFSDLLQECDGDLEAADHLTREQNLVNLLSRTAFPETLEVQEKFDSLRAEMRQHPILKVMSIRDGDTINLAIVSSMLQALPEDIILVDFIQ